MILQNMLIRTRLVLDAALQPLRSLSAQSARPTELKLDDLEDRVLLNAAPAAMVVEVLNAASAESAEQAFDQAAGDLSQQDADATISVIDVGQALPDEMEADVWEDSGIRQAQPDLQTNSNLPLPSGEGRGEGSSFLPFGLPSFLKESGESVQDSGLSTLDSQLSPRHELVFVDTSVDDYQQLLDDLWTHDDDDRQIDVVLLTGNRDGIDQISETLSRYDDLDAVHVVSHGTDGKVKLGSTWLNANNLGGYAGQIAGWQDALTSDADLLFYGCDLAAGDDGQSLMESIGALTGADVAASIDNTGHEILGGDWDLEFSTGIVDTNIAFSDVIRAGWFSVLDTAQLNPTQDTWLDDDDQSDNYGASTTLVVDRSGSGLGDGHAILQFDLSSLPAGATINSATLSLEAIANPSAFDVNVYEVTEAWSEGSGTGTPGAASWDERQAAVNWSTAGGTVDPTVIATSNTGSLGQHTWDVTSLVQAWYSGSSTNNGLMLASPNTGTTTVTYDSREGTVAPVLTVDYTPPPNTAPTITLPGAAINYTENDPVAIIDGAATVNDPDSSDFDTGTLTVDFTSGGTANDRLAIRNQGTGAGQIGVSGSSVTYEGTIIGTFSGGASGSDPLVVTFNANSSPVAAQALMRNVTYENVSEDPSGAARTVRFVLTDGDGGTSNAEAETINVTPVVDDPVMVLLFGDSSSYNEGDPPAVIEQGGNAYVQDVDSPDFSGGNLTVSIAAGGAAAEDVLSIRNQGMGAGQTGLSGANVYYSGILIGTSAGGSGGVDLVVTFNSNATPTAASALIRNITYENTDTTNATTGQRTIRFTLGDGDGGASAANDAWVTVNSVNDPPSVALANTTTALDEDTDTTARIQVADIVVTDDSEGTNTLSLSGSDAALFEIDGSVLYLKAGTVLDSQTNPYLDVTVAVDDAAVGGTPDDSASLTISVTAPDIRVYYGQTTDATPQFREFDGLQGIWSDEFTTTNAGSTIQWTVSAISPDGSEELVAVLSDSGAGTKLDLLRWDGSTWSVDWTAAGITSINANKQGFDVAYESSSGHAIAVYSNNTSNPVYRTWDGTSWSAEASVFATVPGTGTVLWVELASRPGSDEITLVYQDSNEELYAVVWDGSNWLEASTEFQFDTHNLHGNGDHRSFDVAYEQSGDVLVAWMEDIDADGDTELDWATRSADSTVWSLDSHIILSTSYGYDYVDLAADPGSDRIAFASVDTTGTEHLALAMWTGSAWSDTGEYDATFPHVETDGTGEFWAGVGWVGATGEAVVVYSDADSGVINWGNWTEAGGWTIQPDAAAPGVGLLRSVQLEGYGASGLMSMFSDANGNLWGATYDGSNWTLTNGGNALETSLSDAKTRPFSLSVDSSGGNDVPVISLSSLPLAYTENDGAVVIDGTASVSDLDSTDFDTGTLTIDFTIGGTANDRLAIRNQGTGLGQIGTSGSNVAYEGTVIGTYAGGTDGSTPLVVTFDADADATAVQALVRNITYENVSDDPSTAARTVRFVLSDGDGGTSNAVTETLNVTAVNDPPSIATNTGATVAEGGSTNLTSAELAAGDPDDRGTGLTYTVTSAPVNGQLELSTNPGVAIGSFTQDDLDSGRVVYDHDGSQTTSDSFDFSLADGGEDGAGPAIGTFNFTVTNTNDAPVLGNNTLTISEGGTVALSGADLSASDADGDPLTFNVSSVSGGQFELTTNPGSAVTSFTEAQIAAGQVVFVHNGDEAAPSYDVTVTDGFLNDGPESATITFTNVNDAPVQLVPVPQTTAVDTPLVFSAANGNAITINDSDAGGGDLEVTVAAVNGTLTLSGLGGLTFNSGDGTDDPTMTFRGTLAAVNAALEGLSFTPAPSYSGAATVSLKTGDLGNTGAGGAQIAADAIAVTVGSGGSTLSFQNGSGGYFGNEDTELKEDNPTTPQGNNASISVDLVNGVGESQGLIQFDSIFGSGPGQIPYGSTINSASLTVFVHDTSSSSATIALHRMLAAWNENSTWNSMAGGIQLDDIEAAAASDGIMTLAEFMGPQTFYGLEAALQSWSDGATNNGWAIASDSTNGWDFYSSEYGTASQRPYLTVDYTPPQPPVLDLDADNSAGQSGADFAATFTEDGGPVAIADTDAILSDADDTDLQSLTVTITNLLDGAAESLSADTSGTSISASYDSGTGVLALSGSDTVANYQQVLRTVSYDSTSQNPDTTDRVITFVANDGFVDSNVGTATVSVVGQNDAPVLDLDADDSSGESGADFATAFIEDGGPVLIADADAALSDVDNSMLQSLTATITNQLDGKKEILSADTTGTSISASYDDMTGVLTLTGADSIANYQQVLRTVAYVNTSQNPDTTPRSITFEASDGAIVSNLGTTAVSISDQDTPPVLDLDADDSSGQGGADFAAAFTEDGGPVFVADVDASLTDVDSATLQSLTVTITNLLDGAAEGLSAVTGGTSISAGYDSGTGILTLSGADTVANYEQVLRTITYDNTSQDPDTTARILTFVANDGTSDSNAGTTTVTIARQNDAPVVDDQAFGINENTPNGTSVGTIATSDPDSSDSHAFTVLGGTGATAFSVNAITGEITVADSSQLDYETTTSLTLQVQVTDNGTPSLSDTATITVNLSDDEEFDVGPITDNDPAADEVSESTPNGTAVGITALATDGDATDSVTYSLDDDAGGRFEINSTTGVVTVKDNTLLDYETQTSHNVTVRATSTDGSSGIQAFTINLMDDNSESGIGPVTDDDIAANEVPESAANGTAVGITALATDGDATDAVSYSLDDDAGGRFEVDSATGVVTVKDNTLLDHETQTSHNVTVRATSTDGSTSTQTFTISLTDDNTEFAVGPVADNDAAANEVSERAANGTVVGITALATDGDATDTVAYSLDDDAGGRFEIDSATGVITVRDNTLLDYETQTSHNVTVRATSTDGSSSTQTFTIDLRDDNTEFSIGPVMDNDASANEGSESAANGTAVGITALATDGDTTDTVAYSLDDDAGGRFEINATTGVITIKDNTLLDYETQTSHNVTVRATSTDGSTSTQTFNINLTDDATEFAVGPVTDNDATANEVPEGAANGTAVGITALATDGDATDSVNYSLDDDAGGRFEINSTTGVITLKDNTLLDYETQTSHNVTVRATSTDGSSSTQVFTVNLLDENDNPPVITPGQTFSTPEDAANGTSVGTAVATDEDTVGSLQGWAIIGGNTDGIFAIDAATGEITIADNTNLDYETTPVYTLTLTVSDGVNPSAPETVTINVGSVNEAPVNSTPGPQVTGEDTPLVFSAGGGNPVTISDVDAGSNPVLVTLTATNGTLTLGGTAGLTFGTGDGVADGTMTFVGTISQINSALDGLQFDPTANYNGPATIDITVDDQGNIGSGGARTDLDTIDITVTPVNDAPDASDDTFTINEHSSAGTVVGTVTASDIDFGDSLAYRIIGGSGSGVFGIDPATGEIIVVDPGSLVNETNPSFDLSIEVEDTAGATDTAAISILLTNVNDPPVAADDRYTVDGFATLTIAVPGVLDNDVDPDADALTALLVSGPSHGTLSLDGDGSFEYTPIEGYVGNDSFTYLATDGLESSNVATVTLTMPLPDPPPVDDQGDGDDGESEQDPGGEDETTDDSQDESGTSEGPVGEGDDLSPSENSPTPLDRNEATSPNTTQQMVTTVVVAPVESDENASATETWQTTSVDRDNGPTDRPSSQHDDAGAEHDEPTALDRAARIQQEYGTLWSQLDTFQEELAEDGTADESFESFAVGATAVSVTGLSVGYVLWLIRGGTLLASLLSSLPAWASFDPLPVLDNFDESEDRRRDDDDISFQSLVEDENENSNSTEQSGQES